MQLTDSDVYAVPQEHLDFRDTIRQIVTERIAPRAAEIDETGEYPWDVRRLLGEQDILGLPFAEEHGGTGTGTLMLQMAVEEIAKACASSALILMVQELGTLPIQLFGSDELKQRLLPRCATGEWSPAFALSEPEAGSDPASMRTNAVLDGDEWVINGTKNWITNAGVADFYVVFAVTDRENRRMTAFVVEKDRPGLSIGKLEHKLGIKGSPTGSPVFEDVRVPPENVIGDVGKGLARRARNAPAHAPRRGGAGRRHRPGRDRLRRRSTRASASRSASRSSSSRRSSSSSPTWRPAPPRRASCSTRRARWPTATSRCSASTRRWPSSSRPTTPCAVTVEAIQVLGGYGYVKEYPVERYHARRQDHPDLRGHERDPARRDRTDDEVRQVPPSLRRILFAAAIALSVGLATIVVLQGFSPSFPVRLVEAVGVAVVATVALRRAGGDGRARGWPPTATRSPRRSSSRSCAAPSASRATASSPDPEEMEFLDLDPLDDEDFEELVRDALDDLPDLLRNALEHVPRRHLRQGPQAPRLRAVHGRRRRRATTPTTAS